MLPGKGGDNAVKKTLWIITMLLLCIVLYSLISVRMESASSVIFLE